jgi:hypothetical protein
MKILSAIVGLFVWATFASEQCDVKGSADGCSAEDDDSLGGWSFDRSKDSSAGEEVAIDGPQVALAAHEAEREKRGQGLLWAYTRVSPGFGDGIRWHFDLIGLALTMKRAIVLPPLQMDRSDMSSLADVDPYAVNETKALRVPSRAPARVLFSLK